MSQKVIYDKDKVIAAIKADVERKGLKICPKLNRNPTMTVDEDVNDFQIPVIVCGGPFDCECEALQNMTQQSTPTKGLEDDEGGKEINLSDLDDEDLFT